MSNLLDEAQSNIMDYMWRDEESDFTGWLYHMFEEDELLTVDDLYDNMNQHIFLSILAIDVDGDIQDYKQAIKGYLDEVVKECAVNAVKSIIQD